MRARADRRALTRGIGRAALVPIAAVAVHQLRYWLAFHGAAGAVLERQGHAYLSSLAPWLGLLLTLAAGGFLHALGQALAGRRSRPGQTLSFAALWLACATALVALYAAQELLEGLWTTGHPAGLVGIFGFGGLWALPAAVLVGLVLAAALHGARWTLARAARRARPPVPRARAPRGTLPRPLDVLVPCPVPVSGGWSDRGPPRLS